LPVNAPYVKFRNLFRKPWRRRFYTYPSVNAKIASSDVNTSDGYLAKDTAYESGEYDSCSLHVEVEIAAPNK